MQNACVSFRRAGNSRPDPPLAEPPAAPPSTLRITPCHCPRRSQHSRRQRVQVELARRVCMLPYSVRRRGGREEGQPRGDVLHQPPPRPHAVRGVAARAAGDAAAAGGLGRGCCLGPSQGGQDWRADCATKLVHYCAPAKEGAPKVPRRAPRPGRVSPDVAAGSQGRGSTRGANNSCLRPVV